MINSKLISLLKSVTFSEFNGFQAHCQSPIFNKNENVKSLLEYLKKLHPYYTAENMDEKKVFKYLFKNGTFSIQKIRYVFSDLTLILEKYFAYQSFFNTPTDVSFHLLSKLIQQKNGKLFLQHLSGLEKEFEENSIRDSEYYYNHYRLKELSYRYKSQLDNRELDKGLQELVNNLDVMYLTQKLKYACEMFNRKNVLNVQYDIHLVESLISEVPKSVFITHPAVLVYYKILLTLIKPEDEQEYFQLKKVILENASSFSLQEQKDMFTFLQNYSIQKLNKGDEKYLNELFENYEELLRRKIIFIHSIISQFDFKNIVTIALRLKKFDWVKKFIDSHKANLEEKVKENAIAYNTAHYHYSLTEYKNALKVLQQVEFTDIYYHLDAKALLLKIYFETEAEENFLSLANTFKIYLKRNKQISTYQYAIYNNFLKYTQLIFMIKMGGKGDINKIKANIVIEKKIADLRWLNERILVLENNKSSL